jgi:hypothetical protein
LRFDFGKWSFHQSGAFFHGKDLIALDIRQLGIHAARPEDFDGIDLRSLAKTEVQSGILCRLVAHSTFPLIVQSQIARSHPDPGAHAIAIRFCAYQQDLHPMIPIPTVIAEQLRSLAAVVDENVEIPIIIKVANGSTTADAG